MDKCSCLAVLCSLAVVAAVEAKPPVPTDSRLVIELVAREPDIVTPTGIAVNEQGRVWVIENNTHERPTNYKGAASDRVRIFSDFDAEGKARKISTFAEGFRNAMSIALGRDGAVYLATRSSIYLLRDPDGSGLAKEQRVIVRLETKGSYPHNGLSGFAFDGLGNLYFSLGENLGADYRLIGSDGSTQSGGGEGGSIYCCRPDGSKLVRIATGFWNTFHIAFDAFGRLFAVDNDPDSRGPCRLLHIVPGGDYGYRFRNGRKGLHPFTAWNGELPGTLPMVAGTSEAPSGIVAYESTGLPPEYLGDLITTSWGDHVIERFRLKPRGASFESKAEILVRGGEDFRPVGIATGPDGALYLSDWVDKSYPVHGKGRIWRIRMKQPPADDGLRPSQMVEKSTMQLRPLLLHPRREIRAAAWKALDKRQFGTFELPVEYEQVSGARARIQDLWTTAQRGPVQAVGRITQFLSASVPEVRGEAARLFGEFSFSEGGLKDEAPLLNIVNTDPSPFVRMQAIIQFQRVSDVSLDALVPILAAPDPFLLSAALTALGQPTDKNVSLLLGHRNDRNAKIRLGVLLALRRTANREARTAIGQFLADADPGVRRAAIQWVGEERLHEYASLLQAAAARAPVTREVFEALLATNEFLAGSRRGSREEVSGEEYVAKVVLDAQQPPAIRALALSMLRPDHPSLSASRLRQLVTNPDAGIRREAARTLSLRADDSSQQELRRLAADRGIDRNLRAVAILGLAQSAATSEATQHLLLSLLNETDLGNEVLRSLRDITNRPEVERALVSWWQELASPPPGHVAERREVYEQLRLALLSSKSPDTAERLRKLADLIGPRPQDGAQWRALLTEQGDPAAGERVFFHARGPRCFACHRIDGRGAAIGPDLSYVGRALSCDKLIESILTPSKEIAPQFTSWLIATRDGKVRTGMIVDEGPNSTITVADTQGKLEVIHRTEIEERHAVPASIMPDKLLDLMTRREFVDLITFLFERK